VSAELLLSELYKGDDPMMVHLRLQRASTFGTHSDISFNGPKKRLRLHDLFSIDVPPPLARESGRYRL
jgi:hypothetical protein